MIIGSKWDDAVGRRTEDVTLGFGVIQSLADHRWHIRYWLSGIYSVKSVRDKYSKDAQKYYEEEVPVWHLEAYYAIQRYCTALRELYEQVYYTDGRPDMMLIYRTYAHYINLRDKYQRIVEELLFGNWFTEERNSIPQMSKHKGVP